MVTLGTDNLQDIVSRVNPSETHPIYGLLLDEELEDIVLGGIEGIRKIRGRRATRIISQDTLNRAKLNAERTGHQGEELVNAHLERQKSINKIMDFEWTSKQNPIAPYDFMLTLTDSRIVYVDVKSTSTKMQNPIHISYNELLQICNGGERYDIYRVFETQENSAKMIVAENVSPSLIDVYNLLINLMEGVSVDGISVKPALLPFGRKPVKLRM
jgi:uncharacterized protein DUF3883